MCTFISYSYNQNLIIGSGPYQGLVISVEAYHHIYLGPLAGLLSLGFEARIPTAVLSKYQVEHVTHRSYMKPESLYQKQCRLHGFIRISNTVRTGSFTSRVTRSPFRSLLNLHSPFRLRSRSFSAISCTIGKDSPRILARLFWSRFFSVRISPVSSRFHR